MSEPQVTEAMIEAGVKAVYDCDHNGGDEAQLVAAIYLAMQAARPTDEAARIPEGVERKCRCGATIEASRAWADTCSDCAAEGCPSSPEGPRCDGCDCRAPEALSTPVSLSVERIEQIVSAWAFAHNIDGAARNDLFNRIRSLAAVTLEGGR